MPAAVPLVLAAGSAYAANRQGAAARDAGRAAARGADAATLEQQRQFDTLLDLSASERTIGNSARNSLARMLGLPEFNQQQYNVEQGRNADGSSTTSLVGDTELPIEGRSIVSRGGGTYDVLYNGQQVGQLVRGGANGRFLPNGNPIPQPKPQAVATATPSAPTAPAGAADPNAEFFASPDYNFRRTEGLRDIGGAYAARGSGRSGNALRALAEFNSGLASQEFGNRFNRLAALAGAGQTANANAGGAAITTGQLIGRNQTDAANARASGILGAGQAQADGIAGIAGTIPLFADAIAQQRNRLRAIGGYRDNPAIGGGVLYA